MFTSGSKMKADSVDKFSVFVSQVEEEFIDEKKESVPVRRTSKSATILIWKWLGTTRTEWLGSIRKVFGFRVIRHIFIRQVFGMPNGAFEMSVDFIRKDLEVDLEFSTNFSVHIWSGKKFKFWSTDFFKKSFKDYQWLKCHCSRVQIDWNFI